jgi:hypothetical protein
MKQILEDKLPRGTFFADLEDSQFSAIKHAVRLGKELQSLTPKIAQDFRNGKSLSKIAEELGLETDHNISKSTSITAVRYALSGYRGNFTFVPESAYEGLIPLSEYESLVKNHHSENGKKICDQMKKERRGVFVISDKQRAKCLDQGRLTQKIKNI